MWVDPEGGADGAGDAALHVSDSASGFVTAVLHAPVDVASYVFVSLRCYVDTSLGTSADVYLQNADPADFIAVASVEPGDVPYDAPTITFSTDDSCGGTFFTRSFTPLVATWFTLTLLFDVPANSVRRALPRARRACECGLGLTGVCAHRCTLAWTARTRTQRATLRVAAPRTWCDAR